MQVKIGDITKIRTGKLDANASSVDGVYPFFTCSKEPLRISTYSYDCECVLVAGNGDLNVKYYNGKFDAYQRTYIIEDNSDGKLFMPYLYYFMEGYVEELRKQAIGGVIKYIKLGNLTDAMIELPDVEIQKKIVDILSKIKEALYSMNRQIDMLDTLIKARFVEMFGDPIINPRELPVSDLGHLSELITKGASPSWQGFSYTDDATQTLFVTSENVREGYIDISSPKYIEDGFNEKQRRSVLQKGDFLINIVGASIGRAAQFTLDCKANINQAVALVRIEDKRIRDRYLLVYLNSEKAQQMYNSMKSDTGRANLSLQDISNLSILLPPVEEQITFENIVTQVDKSKVAVQRSLNETQILFDSLMQKYFG
ncbi:restriction endonuclease subunit S [Erysipelotrichaceae bacterium Oil+RF-744-GAM-WT-6]|uniref:Restriction endonuclease subunit S n=1 Tax=Stecheria intestinalis TaxID=2606630 RepID=A0A7X2TFQ2_9FIRM|nr:restriction endonuclease subunit S [Stecheria intestinalis]MSS58400.1 restriction endonuclease subunit S [Stecheria intestinalis]